MKKLLASFLLLIIFPLSVNISYGADSAEVIKNLQGKYDTVSTITADFTQQTSNAFGLGDLMEGTLELKKPGLMRWTYSEPVGDLIISDGLKHWVLQADLNQAVEVDAAEGAPPVALEFLFGQGNLDKDFNGEVLEDEKKFVLLKLTPKTVMNVRELKMKVSKKTGLIEMIEINDLFGATTTVILSKIKINREIDDKRFRFVVPKGVHLVKPNVPSEIN